MSIESRLREKLWKIEARFADAGMAGARLTAEAALELCSSHHTAYDNGLFGPDEENAQFVGSFKKILHRYKLLLWRTQQEISSNLLTVLGRRFCFRLRRLFCAPRRSPPFRQAS